MGTIPTDAAGLSFEPIGYVDSIYVRSPMALSASMKQRVRSYVTHGLIGKPHFGKPRGKYRVEALVGFHQPSPDFIPILDGLIDRQGWQLFSVHVALDLLANGRREADAIAGYVTERLVQRHRPPSKPITEFAGTTTYFRERTAPRNIAIYADRRSKCSTRWACHIEARVRRAKTLRRLGITRAADILACDFVDVFRRIMALEEPDFRKLGRLATGRGHAKKPWIYRSGQFEYDRDLRAGQIILRHFEALTSDEPLSHPPVATLVRTACGFFDIRPERVLDRLDLGLLLPSCL